MGNPDVRVIVDKMLTVIASFGGQDAGADGITILPGGRPLRVPPRQDLQVMPADQHDELIVQAIQVLTQDLSNEALKAELERATAGAAQASR